MRKLVHPLAWPTGWPRTPESKRQRAAFNTKLRSERYLDSRQLTVSDALKRVDMELQRLGVSEFQDAVVSVNQPPLAARNLLLGSTLRKRPYDPGAAVYFKLNKQDHVLACDKWDRCPDNLAAIAAHINAMRGIDRWGVGGLDRAFAGYLQLPQRASESWWDVLGVQPSANLDQVEAAFRDLAKTLHPDTAHGSHEAMARITEARAQARKVLA
jgi:hypothetical protein